MTKHVLLSLLVGILSVADTHAATARRATTQSAPATTRATSARAATNMRTAPTQPQTTQPTKTVAARSAKPTTAPTQPKTVAARAATTQKVISTGTKVSTATENTTLDKSCQEKYNGCMDAFCMMDNANGGRCMCSDKNEELNLALSEIERIDEMSYRMATIGVEQLEMGADADAAIAMAQNVVDSIKNPQKTDERSLDFSAWDIGTAVVEDIFKASSADSDSIENKTGSALHTAVSKICKQQIPECADNISTIELLYSQQIKSDCLAYENTIKKKRSQSNEKLQAAERALRETALEQHQSTNKYDLSQCTIKFKECMQTTGGCGDDFSGCASVVAMDNTSARSAANNTTKKHIIKGAVSGITISASTYDTLIAKKPLCDTVTKNCTAVANQVWDTFLKEVAPQIKSAEIIAEDNARQNCIANISECFQKACKDTMDPNDPDGSYDMCLSRPETMLNVCRIPLNACGIDATKKSSAQKSDIWQFVVARLQSIRANACSTQVKECLQSNDNCGPDYSKCIGLDRSAVMQLCPLAKLTACDSSEYGGNAKEIEDYIYTVALGVMLNVDNSLLQACQNIATEKMIEVCGSTTSCYLVEDNSNLGRGSLQTTQDKDNNYIISGVIDFNGFKLTKTSSPKHEDYIDGTAFKVVYTPSDIETKTAPDQQITNNAEKRVNNVVENINAEFNRKISLLANDPKINMCMTGRNIEQITGDKKRTEERFPHLLASYADTIYDSLLSVAQTNYSREYASEISKANSKSQEYRNLLMCYAMADLAEGGNQIPSNVNTQYGIIDQGKYFVKLSGTSAQDLLDAQSKGMNKTIPVRVNGTMVATEELSAVYEPGPQTCRLTSRLYACTGYEAIYEGHSESTNWNTSAGASIGAGVGVLKGNLGVNAGVGGGSSSSDTTHGGNFCNSFAEPVISEQVINFASGEAVFGNVTRSNMQSQYNHSSYSSSYEDNSWGIDLSADVTMDRSQNKINNATGNITNNDTFNQDNTRNTAIGKGAVAGDNSTSNVTETVYNNDKTQPQKKTRKKGNSDNSGGGNSNTIHPADK